ncbi:hypothetical protein [Chryseobacterium caseinilyticum]|uniref:DUF2793 domain-containing protein n=1 Tax=Chryseobacterium caseinilyticum TaxID=2771428 RepID=A0ABR8Z7D2_9FLAO|nr:hypothetical protein [Chryseobacterium caseinilyticum]MBD8081117.1 hypothetical protein [Chryseobacterium caseinilyticum]
MTNFLVPVTVNALPQISELDGKQGMFILPDGSININRKNGTWLTINKKSDYAGILNPADVPVIQQGFSKWWWATAGTYPDAGGLTIDNQGILSYDGSVWKELELYIPQATQSIVPFSTSTFPLVAPTPPAPPIQRTHNNSIFQLKDGESAGAGDVPGSSTKWISISGKNEISNETFTSVINFDKPKKFSKINQTADINFTYNSSGAIPMSMIRIEIVSDGVSNITFSSDFDVIGQVDKTKNQVVFFANQSTVEFKISAVIMNVAKSGITPPINYAQNYIDRLTATGSTVNPSLSNAINVFFDSAITNGYLSKLKGLYLILGSTTASRLVNAVYQGIDATVAQGVVSASGIEGIIDTNINLSTISATDYSYGIFNNSGSVTNMQMSAGTQSANQAIGFYPSSGNGIVVLGPNASSYQNYFHSGSFVGSFIITRNSADLSTVYKDGVQIFQHTENQNGYNLPNANFVLGGFNSGGSFSEDGRILKWGFLANYLTAAQIVSISNDLETLMTAIGR